MQDKEKIFLCDKDGIIKGLLDSHGFSYGLPVNEKIDMEISDFKRCGTYWNYENNGKGDRGNIYRPKEYTDEMTIALHAYRIICIKEQHEREEEQIAEIRERLRKRREKVIKQLWKEKDLEKAHKILSQFESICSREGRMKINEIW